VSDNVEIETYAGGYCNERKMYPAVIVRTSLPSKCKIINEIIREALRQRLVPVKEERNLYWKKDEKYLERKYIVSPFVVLTVCQREEKTEVTTFIICSNLTNPKYLIEFVARLYEKLINIL